MQAKNQVKRCFGYHSNSIFGMDTICPALSAHPLDPLGISPDAALILCFDNPQHLSAQAWDTVARMLALMPTARLVLHLAPEQAAHKDARQALRHKARAAFQLQGAALSIVWPA